MLHQGESHDEHYTHEATCVLQGIHESYKLSMHGFHFIIHFQKHWEEGLVGYINIKVLWGLVVWTGGDEGFISVWPEKQVIIERYLISTKEHEIGETIIFLSGNVVRFEVFLYRLLIEMKFIEERILEYYVYFKQSSYF